MNWPVFSQSVWLNWVYDLSETLICFRNVKFSLTIDVFHTFLCLFNWKIVFFSASVWLKWVYDLSSKMTRFKKCGVWLKWVYDLSARLLYNQSQSYWYHRTCAETVFIYFASGIWMFLQIFRRHFIPPSQFRTSELLQNCLSW